MDLILGGMGEPLEGKEKKNFHRNENRCQTDGGFRREENNYMKVGLRIE